MRNKDDASSPLTPPPGLAEFTWLGLDRADLDRLQPYVIYLPVATLVNANTASREVLAAVLGIGVPAADHVVQARQQKRIETPAELANLIPGVTPQTLQQRVSLGTHFFDVEGQVRLGDRILQEHSLVWRRGTALQVLHREWISHVTSSS
jgi:general secretion pathway protein K